MSKILFLFAMCSLLFLAPAQSQLTSGSITMGITDFGMPGADEEGMGDQLGGMMKNMTMTIHFSPDKQVTDINMMGMMNMRQHFSDGVMTQYMDMMGQKIKMVIPTGTEAFKELGLSQDEIADAYNIEYDKSATKKIAGYDCYQATITMDLSKFDTTGDIPAGMSNMDMTMYVTDDIKMDNFNLQQLPGVKLDGTPLSMTIDMGMMKMTYEATDIQTSVDPSVFEAPEGDYKEMSMEELQQMGVNPGSFGF